MVTDAPELRAFQQLLLNFFPTFQDRINALVDALGGPPGYGRKQWLVEVGGIARHTAARWLDGQDWYPRLRVVDEFSNRIASHWPSVVPHELSHWLMNGTISPESEPERIDPFLVFRICCTVDTMMKANWIALGDPHYKEIVTAAVEHLLSYCRDAHSEITDQLLYRIADSVRIVHLSKQM